MVKALSKSLQLTDQVTRIHVFQPLHMRFVLLWMCANHDSLIGPSFQILPTYQMQESSHSLFFVPKQPVHTFSCGIFTYHGGYLFLCVVSLLEGILEILNPIAEGTNQILTHSMHSVNILWSNKWINKQNRMCGWMSKWTNERLKGDMAEEK